MMAEINYHICDKEYRNCKKDQRLSALFDTIPFRLPAGIAALLKYPGES